MRLLKVAFACATLTASLLLVGCGGTQAAEPEPTSEEPPAETVVEDEDAQPDGEALVEEILSRNDYEPKDVEPDENVMVSMTCVPLTPEQLESLTLRFGIFDRGISVDVTEKDGVTWKIVALQQTAADGAPRGSPTSPTPSTSGGARARRGSSLRAETPGATSTGTTSCSCAASLPSR